MAKEKVEKASKLIEKTKTEKAEKARHCMGFGPNHSIYSIRM